MKIVKNTFFVLFCGFILSFSNIYSETNIEDVIKAIGTNYDKIKSLQVNIKETYLGINGKTQEKKIKHTFKYPDKLKIELLEPKQEIMVLNGKNIKKLSNGEVSNNKYPGKNIMLWPSPGEVFNVSNYLDKYNVIDIKENIFEIEVDRGDAMGRMEWFVDLEKRFIKEIRIYGSDAKIETLIKILEYQNIEDITFPKRIEVILISKYNTIKREINYSDLVVNKVEDKEFELSK